MQKWEYLFLESEGAWNPKVRYVNHEELPNWRDGPPLHEYMNQLGDQGWELVGFDTYGQAMVFKRAKVPS
jgi:hypothetical protein